MCMSPDGLLRFCGCPLMCLALGKLQPRASACVALDPCDWAIHPVATGEAVTSIVRAVGSSDRVLQTTECAWPQPRLPGLGVSLAVRPHFSGDGPRPLLPCAATGEFPCSMPPWVEWLPGWGSVLLSAHALGVGAARCPSLLHSLCSVRLAIHVESIAEEGRFELPVAHAIASSVKQLACLQRYLQPCLPPMNCPLHSRTERELLLLLVSAH